MIRPMLAGAIVVVCALSFVRTASPVEGHEALLKEEGWREDQEYIREDPEASATVELTMPKKSETAEKEVVIPQKPAKTKKAVRTIPKTSYKKAAHKRGGGGGAKKVYHTKRRVRNAQRNR